MSIGINHDGQFIVLPQVLSTIDISALNSVEQGSHGVLVIFAEGTGLLPVKKGNIVPPSSGFTNRTLVPGSNAVKALNYAISPSRETPGASDIILIMPNGATAATANILDVTPATLLTFTTTGNGTRFNDVEYSVDAVNKKLTLQLDAVIEVYLYTDNQMIDLANLINQRSSLVTSSVPSVATGVPVTIAATAFSGATNYGTNQPAQVPAVALASPVAPGNVDNGTHSYKVTFVFSYGEGVPSAASAIVTVVDKTVNGQIQLTAIPIGPTGTTARKIYRTVFGNAAPWKLVTTIANNTATTYTDNTADSGLGANAPAGTLPPASSTQDWQDAFDLADTYNADLEYLATADPTIQSAWAAHLELNKRYGFTGGVTHLWQTFANRQASLASIVSEMQSGIAGSRQVVYEGVGTDGDASYLSSARYAGMAAGLPPYVPLTNKGLAVSVIEADLSDVEVTQMLLAGIAIPIRRRTRNRTGFSIARSLTTWSADDNLFNREYSIGRGVRALEKEIKDNLDQYVGQPATPEIITRALATVDRVLQIATQVSSDVRILSYDRTKIHGTLMETVLRIYYTFMPIPPINWPFAIGALEPIFLTRQLDLPLAPIG